MSNQEILDNAPEGATHIDNNGFYLRAGKSGFMEPSDCGLGWDYDYANHTEVRSLADIKLIAELEFQNQGISVEDKLPATYGSYDNYGNDLTVSDPVVTNKGLACYCSEHDNYGRSVWIGVDWDHKEAGRKLEGVTYWLREAVLDLRNQAKTLKEQGE